jgi:hypothetical protein
MAETLCACGVAPGCVLCMPGGRGHYTATHDALRRLGACPIDDTARRAVERAVGTEEDALW